MKLAFVFLRFRQVIPSQLETILKSHPGVEDAAVVGVKCDDYGELPLAYAMKKPGYDYLNDTSLISFLHVLISPIMHAISGFLKLLRLRSSSN